MSQFFLGWSTLCWHDQGHPVPLIRNNSVGYCLSILASGLSGLAPSAWYAYANTIWCYWHCTVKGKAFSNYSSLSHIDLELKAIQFIFNTQQITSVPTLNSSNQSSAPTPTIIINTHALHNAHLLRHALPCELTWPIPIYNKNTRTSKHSEWAESLQAIGPAKRQATWLKNKAAMASQSAGNTGSLVLVWQWFIM
jgi:hypothetical protein